MKEKLLKEVKSYLEDFETDNIDNSKEVEELQAYVGDAHTLLEQVKQLLEEELCQ